MEPSQPPMLSEEGGETSVPDEHHQQQQEEMSSRIPLDPALASSSPSPTSSSVRHPLHIHHHRRQPTGFHEKQLGDESRGGSDLHHETTSQPQQPPPQRQTTVTTTTMSASSERRSIKLRLLEEITPLPTPAPTPLRQSPLLLRRFRSISLSGRAFAVVSNAVAAANIAEADASASDVVVDESKSDIGHPLKERENGIEYKDINSSSSGGKEKCRVVDHGIITISWYDGTTSNEMQEHVYNCVLRKLNGERRSDEQVAEGKPKLEDVRLLDEHAEVILCPFLPNGSTFVLKFRITTDRPPAPSPPPPAIKASQQPALLPWYIPRAPESPSAEPSLHERFADRTLADGALVPSLGNSVVVQHQGNAPPPQPQQNHLEVQQMLGAVATLLQQQQQQQQQSGGKGGVRKYFDSNAQSNGQLPPLPDVEEESVLISRISSFAAPRDDEKKEDNEDVEDAHSTLSMTPIWNSPVNLANNMPPTASTTLLTSTTTDRLIEEQLRQLNELLRRRQYSEFVQSSDGGGGSSNEVVAAASKALPDDQNQANLVRAYHRNEKKQVMFMISNYLVLFLSLIALSAEIQSRLPQWMAWVQQNYDSVQNCATDQGALMECLSNGDFSGLVASFLLWATQSASAKRIFLFGFDTPKKLWTVVYEALVTAVCWGTSYLFIRRGLNPNTRQNFLQLYWKDAVYGSLAGFNAAFMKAVLKNLVPQEVALEALDGRQLRIRNWIHWLMTDE